LGKNLLKMFGIQNRSLSRRNFLHKTAVGLGGVALSSILSASNQPTMGTHFPARAKRVIQIDTFDYKPELERRAGTPFDPGGKLQFFASKPGNCQPSFWKFRRHGQSGIWMSDLLPKLATCVEETSSKSVSLLLTSFQSTKIVN
jgi:hypothetical protein